MSARLLTLAAVAAALIAAPVCYTLAQPAEPPTPKPAPTDTPKPADAPKPGDAPNAPNAPKPGQPGGPGGPGGEGRRGPDGRGGGGGGGGRGGDAASLPQSIKQSMMIMNRAMRTLSGQVTDATKKDDNLKLIADMQRGCLAAKALAPEKAINREADPVKKGGMTALFRKDLILIMEKLLKVETAILDGKGADAQKLLAEIGDLRDQGHSEFNVQD